MRVLLREIAAGHRPAIRYLGNKPLLVAVAIVGWMFSGIAGEPIKPACCSKQLVTNSLSTNTVSFSDSSIYQVETKWTNDAGKPFSLNQLGGKPQIITMFFASCEYACPLLVYDMQRIEKALPEELRSKVGFTLITFDTERDTPEVLHKYRGVHHVGENWNLLRGSSDDVLEMAALLGVKFKKDARGQFAHSNVITVLDRKGEIISQQIGLNRDPASTAVALRKLLEGAAD